MIFSSLRFYVKSILGILEVQEQLFHAILGALNFADLVNFNLQKVQNLMKFKIQSL